MTNRISNKICFWTWRKWCLGIFCSLNSSIKFPGGVTFIHLKTENSSYDYRMHAIVTRAYECMKDVLSGYHHKVREWKFSLQKWRLPDYFKLDSFFKCRWDSQRSEKERNIRRSLSCFKFWLSRSSESVCYSPNGNVKVFIFCPF